MAKAGKNVMKKRKETRGNSAGRSVIPQTIVPMEVRRIMKSHGNSPRMHQAVIDFINSSGRSIDSSTVPLLSKSGFTGCQIPGMIPHLEQLSSMENGASC